MFTAVDPGLHKVLRNPTAQVYSMTNVRSYEQHIDDCTKIFLDILKQVEGQALDFTDYFHWYAFDVVASITYHRRLGFLDARGDVHGMIKGQEALLPYLAIIGQLPYLHPYLFGNRHMIALMQRLFPSLPDPLGDLFGNIDKEIRRYDQEEKHDRRTDFLAQLRAKDNPDRVNFKRDLMNHLSNNILAGSDTTATGIRAILYFLIKNPTKYKKVVAEIDEADLNGKLSPYVTYEESQKLEYFRAVVKEALRLHAPTCFPLERVVPPEGASLCGYDMPGGTIIGIMAPLINHHKETYGEDADTFRPERWLEADAEQLIVMERNFTTFGHGERACIGKNIALLEMSKFVPQLLRHFDVEWASQSPEWTTYSYWFCKQKDVILRFKSRTKTAT
ncbi:uncharacterized protein Z518_00204 [Rhinocladiella mackenziei CBS 650.93]|uniref:Cytochrome P450 n=1 Tax=Rhinocladiella mackenziei CBS 650.93 TaxID=1442369 RepID=A0A0D2J0F4_9EURO|nr:uncharacterized protein Z518_00204 [Rhinocladiella mackenziei CBS 650.93]KIX09126.1 hypothetical protein Z518_00204 [Rhinocladiella mackenziei CBS 650.93]